MTIEQVITLIENFVPYPDDSPEDNVSVLSEIMEIWKATPEKEKAISTIFRLIEKYQHVDLGSPGPLVHGLEDAGTTIYERALHESLTRKPCALTIWMYSRIINGETDHSIIKAHIDRLTFYSRNPAIDSATKEMAEDFINFQKDRLYFTH